MAVGVVVAVVVVGAVASEEAAVGVGAVGEEVVAEAGDGGADEVEAEGGDLARARSRVSSLSRARKSRLTKS